MRFNRSKHKVLKLLADKLTLSMNHSGKATFEPNLTQDHIIKKLGARGKDFHIVISELRACNEIVYLKPTDSYIINTVEGLTSYSNKKYLLRNNDIIKGWAKDIVQIAIPILSLIITVLVILLNAKKEENFKDEFEVIKKEISNLKGKSKDTIQ